jgi:hypothetical protein
MALLDVVQWLNRPENGFTARQCHAIKKGMTEAEVTGLLGCPSGYYTDKNYLLAPWETRQRHDQSPEHSEVWAGPRGLIAVLFDPRTRRATETHFTRDGFYWPARWYEPILPALWSALEKLGC